MKKALVLLLFFYGATCWGQVLVAPVTAECATSIDGSVVGVPNPLTPPIVAPVFTGTLPPALYFVEIAWYDATGNVTLPGPEIQVQLTATGELQISPPAGGMPASAAGSQVFIGTSSGGETLQGTTVLSAVYLQSVPLVTGAAPPTINTTLCQPIANDAGWPTGTGYNVTVTTPAGDILPGYPSQWQLLGPGNTVNIGQGLPFYNGTVTYPSPILAMPYGHATQSISGGLNLGGYPLTVGQISATGGIILPPVFANYTLSIANGTISAENNSTGSIDFSGTDTAVVVNNVLNRIATTGGTIYFKNGVYPINSLTQETASGWTTMYYGIGIPSAIKGSWVQWHFEGESRTTWWIEGGAEPFIHGNGVIFDVTPTAVASVGGTVNIVAIWQRPDPGYGFTQEDFFKGIAVRFPSNQRGNEIGIGMYEAATLDYENVMASFNMTTAALAATAPVAGSYGITSSYGSSGNLQHFKNVFSSGFQYGYDIQAEHFVADTVTSSYCVYAGIIGRSGGTLYHPEVMINIIDQENQNGWVLGPDLVTNGRIDMIGLDIELAAPSAGWNARVNNLYETNAGGTSGRITYTSIQSNIGGTNIILFAHGGQHFDVASSNGTLTTWGTLISAPSNSVALGSNFTTAANTNLQTVLSWTLPSEAALVLDFYCDGSYSQATGTSAVAFGIQAATAAPTNIFANGVQQITAGPPATFVTGTLPTLTTTTATAIVTGTPGATATNYTIHLAGQIENPAIALNAINVMVSTATSGDAVTVLRGFSCHIAP
jgi:hypothetical protein